MPIGVFCSACQNHFEVPDEMAGKQVPCGQCDLLLKVPAEKPKPNKPDQEPGTEDWAEVEVLDDAPAPVDALRSSAQRVPPSAGRPRGEEALAPRRRRRRRVEEEAHDRPAPRKTSPALVGILVAGAVAAVLLVPCAGVGLWLFVRLGSTAALLSSNRSATSRRIATGQVVAAGQPATPAVTTVELPPFPDPLDIKPAPVTGETSYKLPETVGAIRIAGGGRFLILHFPRIHKLGVFDTSEAKIVRYLPALEDKVFFAGGMTKLVVFLPDAKVIQRYDLLTGAREFAGKLDVGEGTIDAFCLGHASAGPLLVSIASQGIGRGNSPGARIFDIDQFQEIPLPWPPGRPNFGTTPDPRRLVEGYYWAGATGHVFGHTGMDHVRSVVFENGKVEECEGYGDPLYVIAGPDDHHLYAGGYGVLSERCMPMANVPYVKVQYAGDANQFYLPAAHGPYYLHAITSGDLDASNKTPVGTIQIYILGDREPIATYSNTVVCKDPRKVFRTLCIEDSIHLIPRAKLLVVVPEARDELHLYPADLDAALDRSHGDYLIFTSSPPAGFRRGAAFTYQVEIKAKRGPVTFELLTRPPGMTISASGLVHWEVPADFAAERADVFLGAKDAGGQEVYHSFTLTAQAGK